MSSTIFALARNAPYLDPRHAIFRPGDKSDGRLEYWPRREDENASGRAVPKRNRGAGGAGMRGHPTAMGKNVGAPDAVPFGGFVSRRGGGDIVSPEADLRSRGHQVDCAECAASVTAWTEDHARGRS